MLRDLVATYFQRHVSIDGMITVTRVDISSDYANATIHITTLPEAKEAAAIAEIKTVLGDLRAFVGEMIKLKKLPYFSVEIDELVKWERNVDETLSGE